MHQLNFPIIDAHIHQWDPYSTPHAAKLAVKLLGKHPYLLDKMVRMLQPDDLIETVGLTQHVTAPYLPKHYKADTAHYNVEQVVHVEANWHDHKGKGVVDETVFIANLPFEAENLKLGAIIGTADPRDANFSKILKQHLKASPKFRGIRKLAAHHEDPKIRAWTNDPHLYSSKKFMKGFESLAALNLSFDAWLYSSQLPDLIQLAKAFPEVSIVLDHFGTPAGLFGPVGSHTGLTKTARENILFRWQEDIEELGHLPNVYTKMSGLFMPILGHGFHKEKRLATKTEVFDLAYPLICHVLQSFGPYRTMFASNFPMDSVSTSLVNIIDAFSDAVAVSHPEHLQHIFRDNAKQFYRL